MVDFGGFPQGGGKVPRVLFGDAVLTAEGTQDKMFAVLFVISCFGNADLDGRRCQVDGVDAALLEDAFVHVKDTVVPGIFC